MKYLDLVGLTHLWNEINPFVIFFGTCDTLGNAQTKSVTVKGMTRIEPGTRLVVKFTNKNTCDTPTIQVYSSRLEVVPPIPIVDENFRTISKAGAGKIDGFCEFVYWGGSWVLISNNPSTQIIYTESSAEPAGDDGMIWLKRK